MDADFGEEAHNATPQLDHFLCSGPITQLPLGLMVCDITRQKQGCFKKWLILDDIL